MLRLLCLLITRVQFFKVRNIRFKFEVTNNIDINEISIVTGVQKLLIKTIMKKKLFFAIYKPKSNIKKPLSSKSD